MPKERVDKVPTDGLCGSSDEENLGFTYETLNRYIVSGICENLEIRERIDALHKGECTQTVADAGIPKASLEKAEI